MLGLHLYFGSRVVFLARMRSIRKFPDYGQSGGYRLSVGLVATNALFVINSRIVGNPEAIADQGLKWRVFKKGSEGSNDSPPPFSLLRT